MATIEISTIPQTGDTYDTSSVPDVIGKAIERAEKEGYEGREWEIEPAYIEVARKQHWFAINQLWNHGKVGVRVTRVSGLDAVVLTYRQSNTTIKGDAVSGADYTSELVRSKARQLRDAVDRRTAAKMS